MRHPNTTVALMLAACAASVPAAARDLVAPALEDGMIVQADQQVSVWGQAAPGDAALPHALGLLLVREQRLPEALPVLARAAQLDPGQPRYAYVYALALEGAGENDKALAVLRQAGERHPGNQEIRDALERLGSP